VNALRAVARFCYDFVIGDDWRLAVVVLATMAVVFAAMRVGLSDTAVAILGTAAAVGGFAAVVFAAARAPRRQQDD
jgi:hypothetical protein